MANYWLNKVEEEKKKWTSTTTVGSTTTTSSAWDYGYSTTTPAPWQVKP